MSASSEMSFTGRGQKLMETYYRGVTEVTGLCQGQWCALALLLLQDNYRLEVDHDTMYS